MSARELLDKITETVSDSDLKASAIRDRITGLLTDAGYLGEEEEEYEDDDDPEEDED